VLSLASYFLLHCTVHCTFFCNALWCTLFCITAIHHSDTSLCSCFCIAMFLHFYCGALSQLCTLFASHSLSHCITHAGFLSLCHGIMSLHSLLFWQYIATLTLFIAALMPFTSFSLLHHGAFSYALQCSLSVLCSLVHCTHFSCIALHCNAHSFVLASNCCAILFLIKHCCALFLHCSAVSSASCCSALSCIALAVISLLWSYCSLFLLCSLLCCSLFCFMLSFTLHSLLHHTFFCIATLHHGALSFVSWHCIAGLSLFMLVLFLLHCGTYSSFLLHRALFCVTIFCIAL